MTRIPVPADKVRTREQILEGVTVRRTTAGYDAAWVTCHNCGGSGRYPSAMIPPGQCRFYCWKDRTPDTYGKLAVDLETYIKREQAADRRAYRAQVKWEQDAPARAQAAKEQAAREQAELEEKARQEADAAARKAVSQYVGEPGKRLDLELTVTRAASYQTVPFGSYSRNLVTRFVVTLRDVAGNVFVWFTEYEKTQGQQLKVRATVKEHKAYQDERQTVIFRVKEVV